MEKSDGRKIVSIKLIVEALCAKHVGWTGEEFG